MFSNIIKNVTQLIGANLIKWFIKNFYGRIICFTSFYVILVNTLTSKIQKRPARLGFNNYKDTI